MNWEIKRMGKLPKLKQPILIEGLPGIGNVGKVAVDYIVEEIGAKKIFEIFSFSLPHTVWVNENNLVELPTIKIYYKKFKNRKNDLLFLSGDAQPTNEQSAYEFSERILDILEELGGKELITLGGVGLGNIPKQPQVYCTGNHHKIVRKYSRGLRGTQIKNDLFGVVGPIVGVSGLLVGLSKKRKIDGISLLAETFGHPSYLGMRGAMEIVKVLNEKFKLNLKIEEFSQDVEEIEKEIMENKKAPSSEKVKKLKKLAGGGDTSYIG